MTRTEIESNIASLQEQRKAHAQTAVNATALAHQAAGAIQALQAVLASMPAEPAYSSLEQLEEGLRKARAEMYPPDAAPPEADAQVVEGVHFGRQRAKDIAEARAKKYPQTPDSLGDLAPA